MRFTKIVATVGPASDSVEQLIALIEAGVNVFRFNLKHGTHQWHSVRIGRVHEASGVAGKPVAILLDLQGPEIRTGAVRDGTLPLDVDETVAIELAATKEPHKEIVLPNATIYEHLKKDDVLLVDDGRIELVVTQTVGAIRAKVTRGGILGSNKTVSIPALSDDLPVLVEKDIADISLAAREDIDFLALSFVRRGSDVETLRKEALRQGVKAQLIAKIEAKPALDNFPEILAASDGIMVARGDMGVEMPIEHVPFYQKQIIAACLVAGKPVITATQMLESMIESPLPTRAEVSDVANAIYDATDAIMLSAETATGKYPVKAVELMHKTAAFYDSRRPEPQVEYKITNYTDVLTYAASDFARRVPVDHRKIKAIVVLTETGYTAKALARLRPPARIIALTRSAKVRDQLLLVWGVEPILFKFSKEEVLRDMEKNIGVISDLLKKNGLAESGETVILVFGHEWGVTGNTNSLRIQMIP